MKIKRINVRVSEKEKIELSLISAALDIPEALIVREAVKEKIAELKKRDVESEEDSALAK